MKTSNYVIYIHVTESDNYYLVHGYTGAVDKVSPDVVKFLLDHVDPLHTWHIKDQEVVKQSLAGKKLGHISISAIDLLKARGYLTAMSSQEERSYVGRLAAFLHNRNTTVRSPVFMIVPLYQCNLRCPYCFETETRVKLNKKSLLNNLMTQEMADAAFRSMEFMIDEWNANVSKLNETSKPRRHITLYGGEPLMQDTLPIINYIVPKSLKQGYSFSAITNGVELQHFFHLLGPEKISTLQITLDGPKDVHDRTRIGHLHKKGTYEKILQNISLALETGTEISIRLHTNWHTVNRVKEVVEDIEHRGLLAWPNFSMYAHPVHNFHQGEATPRYPYLAIHEMHKELDRSYPEIYDIKNVRRSGGGVKNKLRRYIKGKLPAIYMDMEPCAATTGMYIFDPLGRIYSCWDTVGIASKEVGSYSAKGYVLNDRAEEWKKRSPAYIDDCKDCKYLFFHFGGCASIPLSSKGTILAPACFEYQDDFIYFGRRFFRGQGGSPSDTLVQLQTSA